MANENKIFAVKRKSEFWAVIDCGEAKEGGFTTGSMQHFKKDGRCYRWYSPIYNPPSTLQDWQEIKLRPVEVVDNEDGISFEGWDDKENGLYETFSNFSKLIGKPMTVEEVKQLLIQQSK